MILRFHPGERERLEPTAYITTGKELRGDIMYSVVTYSFYFRNNYAIGCGWRLFPKSGLLGYHEHDVEFISVYYFENVPVRVFFSAHGRGQGSWVEWEDCEFVDDQLVVYVARNSHAMYPHTGRYWRVFGFANDVCSSRGKELRVYSFTSSFDCCFGNGVSLCAKLRPSPPGTSITPWQRFFLPLSQSGNRL